MHGLETFEEEARRATSVKVGGIVVHPCCRLKRTALRSVGVRKGDLLVATEGAATLVRIRCSSQCVVATIADLAPQLRMAKDTCFSFQLAEHQLGDEGRANDAWAAGH